MECPWCKIGIEIDQINCGVFRCGILKSNGLQIPPHLGREAVEKIRDFIWGCGHPFKLKDGVLIKCEWSE